MSALDRWEEIGVLAGIRLIVEAECDSCRKLVRHASDTPAEERSRVEAALGRLQEAHYAALRDLELLERAARTRLEVARDSLEEPGP